MSLGLNDPLSSEALAVEPRHKSAGVAFAMSVVVPGAGQLYCDKTARGAITLVFWVLAVIVSFAHLPTALRGEGLLVMLVLWIFSFLDSYFTAIEINKGIDDLVDVQNPRVAVTLNLLTAGFGYFYLGERTKGIALFLVTQVGRFLFPSTGFWGLSVSLILFVLQLVVALDAYRIARRQLREASGPELLPFPELTQPVSRLPVQVPIALACLLVFGSMVFVVVGLIVGATRTEKRHAHLAVSNPPRFEFPDATVRRNLAIDSTPVPAVDLVTAVQNIQQVQRKAVPLTRGDIPNLQRDVRVLTTVLGGKTDASDGIVAHYFRALAFTLINNIQSREGGKPDGAMGQKALADLEKVINGGAATSRTYVPAVSISNAQYWAGIVARNDLRDDKKAYRYWEQCAGEGHAGCMNTVATAHITGEGGEKVDIRQALDLHTAVFNSGTKFYCAGAMSAMDIAFVNYFTGVRRPGDDEQEWMEKADTLLDSLEARQNNRDVCGRGDSKVDEFLMHLSHGQRDDNILQDALSRLSDDSRANKAVIQYFAGAIDDPAFEQAVEADKSRGAQCSAYFDAMWYAEIHNEQAQARRYHQHLLDIGKFHCGVHLVFAKKFNF